jgi:hypothetical protein
VERNIAPGRIVCHSRDLSCQHKYKYAATQNDGIEVVEDAKSLKTAWFDLLVFAMAQPAKDSDALDAECGFSPSWPSVRKGPWSWKWDQAVERDATALHAEHATPPPNAREALIGPAAAAAL